MLSTPFTLPAGFVHSNARGSPGVIHTFGVILLLPGVFLHGAPQSPVLVIATHPLLKLGRDLPGVVEGGAFLHLTLRLRDLDYSSLLIYPGSVHRDQDRPRSQKAYLYT